MKKEDSNKLYRENEKLRQQIEHLEQSNLLYKTIIDKLPFGIQVFENNTITQHFNPEKDKQINLEKLENEAQTFLKSLEYLSNFYEKAPLPYQSLDEKGCFLEINQTWLDTLGYKKDEVTGKCFIDFLHPDYKEYFEKNFSEFKTHGTIRNLQFKLRHKNGHYLKVSFQGCVGYETDGTFRQTYCVFKDITEQERIEKQLRESEERYRKIVENINDAMVIHDKKGTITFVNEHACKLFKYKKEELIGLSIVKLHSEENIKTIKRIIKEQKWMDQALLEQDIIAKDGSRIPVEINTKKVLYHNNLEIHSFIRNITGRKKAEQALKESEKNFRLLFKHSPLGVYIADPKGNLIDANDSLLKMLGSPSIRETQKINVLTFPPLVEQGYAEAFKQTVVSGNVEFREHSYTSKWGKGGYYSSYLIPLKNRNGEVEKVYTLVEDITERKEAEKALRESEEKFRSFVNTTSDGIRLSDPNGKIIFVNDAHTRLTGYSKEETEGAYVWDFAWQLLPGEEKTPEKYKSVQEKLKSVMEGESSYLFDKPYDLTIQTKQGNILQIQEAISKIPGSQFIRYGATIRDITKMKKQEEKLVELNNAKDKFFSIISHDLRNPFHAILGFSQLAIESVKKGQINRIEKYATEIYKSAQQSYNLLNNLLDWSRIQRGNMVFEPQPLDLKSIADKTINLLKINAENKNLQLNSFIEPETKIYGDRFMLETIIRNLVSNALKYTPPGGKVTVKSQKTNRGTTIIVEDTGVGISKENVPKLFKIDDNYSTKGTDKEQGTGLGLILCKEFVGKHGGKIEVESEINKGSQFRVTIPDKQ